MGLLWRTQAALSVFSCSGFGALARSSRVQRCHGISMSTGKNVFDMEIPCQTPFRRQNKCEFQIWHGISMSLHGKTVPCQISHLVSSTHLTWKVHVKAVHFGCETFDMELHVKYFHVTHVKSVLDSSGMEIPCQMRFGHFWHGNSMSNIPGGPDVRLGEKTLKAVKPLRQQKR